MADTSVSDVKVKFAGVDFTLRASIETLVKVEQSLGEAYPVVMNRVLNQPVPRLLDLSEVFAAFALPHGKHTPQAVRTLIAFEEQSPAFRELREAIAKAIDAALPKKTQEAGDAATADPQ